MDDVLDSVCAVYVRGDHHRRVLQLVPLLLRGEDTAGYMAAVTRHQGLLHPLQEVCASRALQERTGYNYLYTKYTGCVSANPTRL